MLKIDAIDRILNCLDDKSLKELNELSEVKKMKIVKNSEILKEKYFLQGLFNDSNFEIDKDFIVKAINGKINRIKSVKEKDNTFIITVKCCYYEKIVVTKKDNIYQVEMY